MSPRLVFPAAMLAMFTAPAVADPATPKLHPVEKACITYELNGQMQSGTVTRCHRDFGYESYEIQQVSIGFGGFSQTQSTHTITIGDTIYAIDLQSNTATQTINPMYAGMVDSLENASPEELGTAFLAAMDMSPTGATQTVAGEDCSVYSSSMMGTACFTNDWLMVEQSVMGMGQSAISVDRASGGANGNYTLYQNMTVTDGPDLSNLPGGLADLLGQEN